MKTPSYSSGDEPPSGGFPSPPQVPAPPQCLWLLRYQLPRRSIPQRALTLQSLNLIGNQAGRQRYSMVENYCLISYLTSLKFVCRFFIFFPDRRTGTGTNEKKALESFLWTQLKLRFTRSGIPCQEKEEVTVADLTVVSSLPCQSEELGTPQIIKVI